MGIQIDRLNSCCPAFDKDKVGTILSSCITLLNEAKLRFNSHTHPSANNAPDSTLISAAAVTAITSVNDLNSSCAIGDGSFGNVLNNLVTLINEIRTNFNTHGHTAIATVATEQLTSAALSVISALNKSVFNSVCFSMEDPLVGDKLESIVSLINEIRSDFNAHVHPTLITNPADLTVATADVAAIV